MWHFPSNRPFYQQRRGAAMMIVLIVIGVATVLGFAMVSASSLQAQTDGNLKYVASAEYLADSGAQLALYYLQYPAKCPVAMPSGYYPGQTGATFGGAAAGSADITVTYDSTAQHYTITSVGKATTSTGTINKTVTATAALIKQFKQTSAVGASGNIKLAGLLTTIIGDLDTNGTLTVPTLASISGTARYRSLALPHGSIHQTSPLAAGDSVQVPTLSTIKDYTGTYTYQGHTYTAQKLTSGTLSNKTLPTASDALTNPAGIYWYDNNVTLGGNFILNGTLIITNGKATVSGLLANTITAKTGFPAMVIQSDINISGVAPILTVNGLVWTGGGLKTGSLSSVTAINGAYLSAGGTPIDTGFLGLLTITYDASKVAVPDFSTTNAVTMGVRVVSWVMS